MNTKDQAARIAELEAALAAANATKRSVRVVTNTETGTVQIRGLRQPYPVAFYPGEWDVIFSADVQTKVKAQLDAARPIADAHRKAKEAAKAKA